MGISAEQLKQLHGGEQPAVASQPQFQRGTSTPKFESATKAQTNFIRKQLENRQGVAEAEAVRDELNAARQGEGVSKKFASEVIDRLKKITPVSIPAPAPKVRVNKYGGRCESCTKRVEAGEGRLSQADDGSWQVWHLDGECPETEFPFPYGRYAIEVDGEVKFYAATEEGLFAQGGDDLHLIHNAGHRKAIIEAIAVDPLEASKRWGIEFETCGRCGRGLTSDWRKVGIGPVCSQKEWL